METQQALDMLWVLISTALVFLMQAGFGCLEAGSTRAKNSTNVAIKNLIDLALSCLVYWAVGYGLMFGASAAGVFGTDQFLFDIAHWKENYVFLFQMVFCGTATTILSGAVAERMQFSGYLFIALINALLIYPVFGHWVWNDGGVLGELGFVDFAGSTVVHSVGGWVGLAGIIIIGARTGRFNADGSVNKINGWSLPMSVLGALILWFGWIGFNGGSTLEFTTAVPGIILNTLIAGAAGGMTAVLLSWFTRQRPECEPLINGSLAGLVAITACCHMVSAGSAVLIGAIGGIVMLLAEHLLLRCRLDDAVGAIPVHLAAGIWGTLAVALFGDLTIIGDDINRWEQLGIQALGIAIAGAWAFGLGFTLMAALNRLHPLRVSAEFEQLGLNVAEHGAANDLQDFFRVMSDQERTGDLSLRAPEEPFTEVGQIARRYNHVLEKVEATHQELVQSRRNIEHILNSLTEGLIVVRADLTLDAQCSDEAKHLLGYPRLEGLRLEKALFPDADALGETQACRQVTGLIQAAFDLLVPEQFADLAQAAPRSFRFRLPGTEAVRTYAISYSPLIKDDAIERVVLVIKDETELAELRSGASSAYRLISRTISGLRTMTRDDRRYAALTSSISEFVPMALEVARGLENLETADLNSLFRKLHTIKGGTRLLNLDFLQHFAHEAETKLASVRDGDLALEKLDTIALKEEVDALLDGLEGLHGLLLENERDAQQRAADPLRDWQAFVASLAGSVEQLAADLGKQAQLTVHSDVALQGPDLVALQKMLIHLTRNALDHGIESPDERRGAGKPAQAALAVDVTHAGGRVQVKVQDDGRGINAEAMYARAVERGIIPAQPAQPDLATLIDIMCAPGFSTRSTTTDISGRGVGMDAVRDEVENLGGKITLVQTSPKGSQFALTWRLLAPATELAASEA